MQLPEHIRERLASEFRFAAQNMAKSADPATKLYYFSVLFGETQRAFNLAWHPALALTHLVTQQVYLQIQQRVNEMAGGIDRVVGLPEGFAEAFTKLGIEFAELFESQDIDELKLYTLLARASELGYVSNGNGHYLYLRGQIKI